MTTSLLPADLAAWADAEVAAGRAASVDDLIASALRDRKALIALRQSLDEAEAETDGEFIAAVFDRLKARFPGA